MSVAEAIVTSTANADWAAAGSCEAATPKTTTVYRDPR